MTIGMIAADELTGRPLPDGAVARVPHRPVVLRRGVPGDDLRAPPTRASATTTPTPSHSPRSGARCAAVLFAVGAVSGTILSFEMGLLWPGLMSTYGDVIGLPFALEGVAFFLEAIFLGIYLYGWGRLRPEVHLRTLDPDHGVGSVRHVLHPGGQLVDERTRGVHTPAGRHDHRRRPGGGDVQRRAAGASSSTCGSPRSS